MKRRSMKQNPNKTSGTNLFSDVPIVAIAVIVVGLLLLVSAAWLAYGALERQAYAETLSVSGQRHSVSP